MTTSEYNVDRLEEMTFKNDPIVRFFRELGKVKDDQRSLVLVTNGFLELMTEVLIRSKCKNAKRIVDYPYATKLLVLHEVAVLSDQLFEVFEFFRKLRNRAAHEPFFEITTDDLEILSPERFRDPANFHHACMDLMAGFWNKHIDIFGPAFAPTIVGSSSAQPGAQADGLSSAAPAA